MLIQRYIKLLRTLKFQVILVFDGLPYPSKQPTTQKRAERRAKYKKRGDELLIQGQIIDAMKCFRQCTSISRANVHEIIHALHGREGIEIIEAPYEADAQLAYLSRNGLIEYIITEDSDLIVYGCVKIIFKLKLNGDCVYYNKNDLQLPIAFDDFRKLCILAGCDYLPGGLKGIGIKKGLKLLQKTTIDEILANSSEEFRESFRNAEDAFRNQLVFDPINMITLALG
jgi:exonuclease-1